MTQKHVVPEAALRVTQKVSLTPGMICRRMQQRRCDSGSVDVITHEVPVVRMPLCRYATVAVLPCDLHMYCALPILVLLSLLLLVTCARNRHSEREKREKTSLVHSQEICCHKGFQSMVGQCLTARMGCKNAPQVGRQSFRSRGE